MVSRCNSFRRALGPWGPGGRARRRRRRARRRRRSARSAALSGHLRSRNGLRSGCTPGMEGTSKALKSLFFDGVTGRSPGAKNARLSPLPAIRLPVESCGQTSGGGSRIGPLGRGETRASIPLGAVAPPAVRRTSLKSAPSPHPPARHYYSLGALFLGPYCTTVLPCCPWECSVLCHLRVFYCYSMMLLKSGKPD